MILLIGFYGCIESTFLWYKILSTTLEGLGFGINLYDRCFVDKIIEGTQRNIDWYTDDNNLSHKNLSIVS